jgi:hypothetical protein
VVRPTKHLRSNDLPGYPSGYSPDKEPAVDPSQFDLIGDFWVPKVLNGKDTTQAVAKRYIAQERAIQAYAQHGTWGKAAQLSKISYKTISTWRRNNTLDFVDRSQHTFEEFLDYQEELLLLLIEERGPNVVQLLIFYLKARHPAYRDAGKSTENVGAEMLWQQLKEMRSGEVKEAESAPIITVEEVVGDA